MKGKYGLVEKQAERVVLLKYFPKYYRRLDINNFYFKRGSVLPKLKQIKTIENFQYNSVGVDSKKISKLTRILLQTKRKSIRFPIEGVAPIGLN